MLPPDQSARPDIEVEIRPQRAPQFAAIISLRGEHDLSTSAALREALDPIFGHVLVDLSACDFVDSTVIGVLIAASQQRGGDGHALSLVVPPANANVARTLEIVRIGELLRIYPAVPGAERS